MKWQLTDKNSYVRTRGFGLICSQARWDHEVVLYLPEMSDDIVAAVQGIDLSKYKDSMSPLIKKDAEELLRIIGEYFKNGANSGRADSATALAGTSRKKDK